MHRTRGRVDYDPIERPGNHAMNFAVLVLRTGGCGQQNKKQCAQE